MSRVTAAFVCALCDPDNPRPASIMCSNNCGRYVCATHAIPRKGPGSAMVCLACAEALGFIEKPRPQPLPEVRPLIEIPPEPAPQPVEAHVSPPIVPVAAEAAGITQPLKPEVEASPVPEQVTVVTPRVTAPSSEPIIVPAEQQTSTDYAAAPEPKSVASETVVSQRGNTLQVPKVTPTLGKPPAPIAKPRKALRFSSSSSSNIDWLTIGMIAGTVVLGIIGFVFVLAALAG